ncbi:hypothetical protein BU600_04400 [Staphylococcus arlettae]|uniref:hypothetical protein n=1 Tax=Staphylococcus arlettae TaxID=29378 RepID=UPI000D1A5E07|nr:hypothetical protein [Staphylococcus arlettae]PTH60466.1 hypothetical protein BU599_05050 [Staphylococcus arlettae]RIM70582.1 hypothetical protein BU600_04400 [Staphylococcus arlettae]RIM74659.1 hypothetical protein BU594_00385 [Staphylococcus arlettae]
MRIEYKSDRVSMSKNEYSQVIKELNKYKAERDTLIDDLTWYKAKVDRLEHENKRLTRLTHKLTTHRTMWDNLKNWRRDMLVIDKNDTQLIGLGLVIDELEHNWLYKERADDEIFKSDMGDE